jgi:hypothetical protein
VACTGGIKVRFFIKEKGMPTVAVQASRGKREESRDLRVGAMSEFLNEQFSVEPGSVSCMI